MADRIGYLVDDLDYGSDLPVRSAQIVDHEYLDWDVRVSDAAWLLGHGPRAGTLPVSAYPATRSGYVAHSYFNDFYFRIHIAPRVISLGNLVSEQVRVLTVWNAWPDASRTLTGTPIDGDGGMVMTPPSPLPITFAPLKELTFELSIGVTGASVIDATLTFEFSGLDGIPVKITGQRLQAWPVPADWGSVILESLTWYTDLQTALDGSVDAEPKRDAPRRTWEFDLIEGRRERRIVENAVYDWAGRNFALPVMPDVSLLPDALPADSTAIAIDTQHLDFHVGGIAMLWLDALRYEMIEIADLDAGSLTLARPTLQAWPRGTRLYPCRIAMLTEAPQWRRRSDQVIIGRARFEAMEPCDWPAIAPAATYRGYPVFDPPGDESQDPTAQSARRLEVIDGDLGLIAVDDVTGLAWQRQSYEWLLGGRAERAAHRSLLYWFEGQARTAWLPTFADDVQLLDPLGGGATTLTVANAGISRYLRGQPGRRHIRIALYGGGVFYREVLAAAELDDERESLLIDAAVGVAIQPGQVRVISWMMLARRASDRVEIGHINDSHGVARCRDGFEFAGAGEPAT